MSENYERPTSCQCATSNPPCSYCTSTVVCDKCQWQGYPDELIESVAIAGVPVDPARLCPQCGEEVTV